MGMMHKKSRTTGKRPWRTGEKAAKNTGTDFPRLRVKGGSFSLNKWSENYRKPADPVVGDPV